MKLTNMRLVLLLLSTTIIFACSKDEESKSATDLLTGGSAKSWRIQSRTFNGTLDPIDSCEADDFLTFNKSGNTFTDNPGNITCGASVSSGTWALSNNNKVLTMTEGGNSNAIDINELSEHKLVLKGNFTDTIMGVPTAYTVVVTLGHVK